MASNAAKTGMYIGVAISVFILLAVVGVILFFLLRSGMPAPTRATTDPGKMEVIELNLDVSTLMRPAEIGSGGAEEAYGEAFALAVKQGEEFVDAVKKERDPLKNAAYKAIIDKLVEGSEKGLGSGVLLNFDAAQSVGPLTEFAMEDTLMAMASLVNKAGMDARVSNDRPGAERFFRALFVFGQRLWHQGAFIAYKSAGLGVMGDALQSISRTYSKDFYDDPAKVAKVRDLDSARRDVAIRWEEKKKDVAPRKFPNNMEPGDLHNIAEHDKDHAWRLEGIIWLGAAQWTNPRGGRKAIQEYLQQKTTAGDPLLAQKAKQALGFKREDVQLIH